MGEGKRRRDRGWTRERAIAARLEREREHARMIAELLADARAEFPDAIEATPELAFALAEAGTLPIDEIDEAMSQGAVAYVPSARLFLYFAEESTPDEGTPE